MIKLAKGVYLHFAVVPIFFLSILSGTFEITAMAFLIAVCHEFCHLLTALILKVTCRGIAFMPYGCRLYIKESTSPVKDFIIALSAPLLNAIFALLIKEGPLHDINIAMAIINSFPVMPLDGGRMMYAFLSILKGSFFAVSAMKKISFFGSVSLIAVGVYQAVFTGFNLSVFTAGTFLLFSAITDNGKEKLYMNIFSEKDKLLSKVKKGKILAVPESLPLRKVLSYISFGDYVIVKVIGKDGKIKSEMSEEEIKDKLLCHGAGVRFREIT